MVNPQLIERFNDCVERLLSGATVDECLRQYPDDAAALRPLLESGQVVRRLQPTNAEIAAAQARGQARLDHILAQPYVARRAPSRRWVSTLAGLAALFLLLFAGAAYAAESTLPGDALYPLKLFTENVRGAVGGEAVREVFAARRVDEVRDLLALGRSVFVTFAGVVDDINGAAWRVEGIPLLVTDATRVDDDIDVGDQVQVSGLTTPDSTLLASELGLLDDRQTPPTPQPTLVPTLALSATATITPSLTPTLTLTATATQTETATVTATVTPSPTATPTPSATPSLAPSATAPATLPSTASALCTPAPPQGWGIHTVRQGDTVSGLAATTGTTIEMLLNVNCLTDPRFVFVGQLVYLPFTPSGSSSNSGSGGSGSSGGSSPTSPPGGGGGSGGSDAPPPDDDDDGDDPDDFDD